MSDWKRNLPNEHGGWVLISVGIVAGIAANPGPWQIVAALAWIGLFFARVPLTRLLDGKSGPVEWTLAIVAGLTATVGFVSLGFLNPRIVAWFAVALLPGGALILFRRRRFLRSVVGEMLSAFVMVPVIPSIALAGPKPIDTPTALNVGVAVAIYMVASVFRVRAVARTGRDRVTSGEIILGTAVLPLAVLVAWFAGFWTWILVAATGPAIVIGIVLTIVAGRRRLPLPTVGLFETAVVIVFAAGLVVDLHRLS